MTKNSFSFNLDRVLSPEYILKKSKFGQKLERELKLAVSRAGLAGAKAMREVILDSPTNNGPWHRRQNIWRAGNRPMINGKDGAVNNDLGSRLETGNMYNSVSYKRGKKVAGPDARFKQGVTGGFGWPADASGNIKDAPSAPMARSRNPDTPNWRSDPRYFAMQEYGFDKTPGMFSQEKAAEKAAAKLREELNRLKGK